MKFVKKFRIFITSLALLILMSPSANSTEECFEKASRAVFNFNMVLDDAIIEPLAKGYNKLPSPIRTGTSNFTSNVATLLSIPNNVLQGNLNQLGHSIGSFVINTTVGIFGFLNPAEKIGLKPNKEDVGQTLGSYGIGPGCYFVLPVLGPSTLRDSVGFLADSFVDPFAHITIRDNEILGVSGNDLDYFTVKGTTAVDFRADQDTNLESLEKNSLDFYSALKSVYLQDRENKIKNSTDGQDEWGNLDN